jgi:predicted ATP-dependent serine protease
MLKVYDFYCELCDEKFDAIVDKNTVKHVCEACGNDASKVFSACRVGKYNTPEATSAALQKRSHEHSVKQARKNAEQLASKLGGVAKPQAKWNIRSTKKENK